MKGIQGVDVKGKRVFVRADFNVPISNGKVADSFRIEKTLETIQYLVAGGAHIILASHIENDAGENSLRPVYEYLQEKFPMEFVCEYYPNTPVELGHAFENGKIVLLENLRKYEGEKNNDDVFAKHLSSFADIFVNESFATSHRRHASLVKIPTYIPAYAGIVFEQEVTELSRAFHPEHPFLFILGGAKFETKLPLIQKFFALADKVFIGGALANDFLKAKGVNTGISLLSKGNISVAEFLTDKLILPVDVRVKTADGVKVKKIEEIDDGDFIVDVGPQTIESMDSIILDSKFILWNGPLGNYEIGFKDSTLELAKKIANSSAMSIVGGGDTVASIAELGLSSKFSFISTGGGAMLDFLANETLPGIEALG